MSAVGILLACTGAIKDDYSGCGDARLQADGAARWAGAAGHASTATARHPAGGCDFLGYDLLQQAGRRRGFLLRGGEIDTERMARILLDEFRGGVLGRITLEKPE